ncbi:patatin-like phospholipase family protein [Phenylobacterium sp. LjRoot164]|uniref:patatin-like phospholipase family protein n=1 Tax=unclassified Phenylobacterium TaxID=2640670 RepID=UPI003ECF6C1C
MSVADALALVKRLIILSCMLGVMWLGVWIAPAFGQEPPEPARPKIGLVLSGGGAMGMAHVGAIQTLEKLGIRPDLVVGTSMGSIVGGLYASGMSGAELEHAIETMDWDLIFDTSPPREGLTYREKQLQAAFPVKASVGVAGTRLRRPDALISDANLLLELRRLVRVRAAVPTFDDLPIPFRAVATDIETGKKVVLDRGELAGAMRASMSVPGVFAPYSLNGHLLVDGGMSDNVPIDVARDMGADIVIVVATQTPLLPADQLRSLGGILGQTVTLLILANERQQLATLKPSDVLISVDTGTLSSADFKRGAEFIALGKAAAEKQLGGLQRVAALGPPQPAISIEKPPPRIDYVKVENDSRLSDEILLRRIEPFIGKPMAPDEIGTTMRDIYAMGMFSRVDYRIEEAADGRTGLVVNAVQRPGDANRLRPAMTIAASSEGGTEFDFSAELRLVQLDSYGSEARFVGALGERTLFSAEYFKVLDSYQRWFVDVMGSVQKRPIRVYNDTGFRLGEYDASYGLVSLAVGRQFGTIGEVRAGVDLGTGSASLQEGDLTPRDFDLDWGQLAFGAGADTLDNPYFPSRGMNGRLQWNVGLEALGSQTNFQTLRLDSIYAVSKGRQALNFNISGGDTIQGDLPLASLFTLGGPFSFPGYSVEELTGETFAVARGMYRYKLTDSSRSLLSVPIYVGATLVVGNAWARHGDAEANDVRVGANVFLAADTLIGPVFITAGAADDGRMALYFFVGKPF